MWEVAERVIKSRSRILFPPCHRTQGIAKLSSVDAHFACTEFLWIFVCTDIYFMYSELIFFPHEVQLLKSNCM